MSRTLDEAEYQNYICDDLTPVLKLLSEGYGIGISRVHLDMKGIYTDVYLNRRMPDGAIEALGKEFSQNPNLRFTEKWIACKEHYCSVESALPEESTGKSKSGRISLGRIKQFVLRAFGGRRRS